MDELHKDRLVQVWNFLNLVCAQKSWLHPPAYVGQIGVTSWPSVMEDPALF